MSRTMCPPHRGLSGTTLKLMALALMLLDHIHYFFAFTGAVPLWFTQAGRLAAPLFLFCTVEGFAHTHDRRRYFLRIWAISAGMGLLLFLMMYAGVAVRPDGFYPLNAVFMNFVILIPVWQGIDWLGEKRLARGLAAVVLPLVWPAVFLLLYAAASATPAAWLLDSFLAALACTVLPAWKLIPRRWLFLPGDRHCPLPAAGAAEAANHGLCAADPGVLFSLPVCRAGVPAGLLPRPDVHPGL